MAGQRDEMGELKGEFWERWQSAPGGRNGAARRQVGTGILTGQGTRR